MGLDSPCPPCPVALGIQGPKTYLDPIRHIYETVDAVETVHSDGSRGHVVESENRRQKLLKEALDTAERANVCAEDVRHTLNCGMNAHLAKPLDVEKMIHTIALYL